MKCDSLSELTIPANVTTIGDSAFALSGLQRLTLLPVVPPVIGENTFRRVSDTIPVIVPCGSVPAYQDADSWNHFIHIQDTCGNSISEISQNNSVILYPNPAVGYFTVESKNLQINKIMLFDLAGKLRKSVDVKNSQAIIDISSCPRGMYLVRIITENGIINKKVLLVD